MELTKSWSLILKSISEGSLSPPLCAVTIPEPCSAFRGLSLMGESWHGDSACHSSSWFRPLSLLQFWEWQPENQKLPQAVGRSPLVSKWNEAS